MPLPDARTFAPAAQEQVRLQAVRLREEGRSLNEVARICGVAPTTVSEWHTRYRVGGADALRQRKRGRREGEQRELSAEQEKKLHRWIAQKMPEQMQFPFMLWTRRVIAALIEREFGVQLSLRSISSYPAVSNQGLMRFMIYDGGMNAQRLICFMHRLIKDNDRKVFLILDNLRVHHARKVRAWVARHSDEIELFQLPPYAPNSIQTRI